MSGRSLRRLPVLAHAKYIGSMGTLAPKHPRNHGSSAHSKSQQSGSGTDVLVWLDAMDRVVESQATERERLNGS